MQKQKITARDFSLNSGVEHMIRAKTAALERYYERITSCEVAVEGPVHHHRRGGPFKVRIRIAVPRGEIEVNRQADEDLGVAIREAFDAARRRIEDHARELRGQVKAHEQAPRARVTRLMTREGFGFLTTPEGDQIYFHRNSVMAPGFDHLLIGTEVRFVPEIGEGGPQASTVAIIEPHRRERRQRAAVRGPELSVMD
jgi:cold shock CspA family protein